MRDVILTIIKVISAAKNTISKNKLSCVENEATSTNKVYMNAKFSKYLVNTENLQLITFPEIYRLL